MFILIASISQQKPWKENNLKTPSTFLLLILLVLLLPPVSTLPSTKSSPHIALSFSNSFSICLLPNPSIFFSSSSNNYSNYTLIPISNSVLTPKFYFFEYFAEVFRMLFGSDHSNLLSILMIITNFLLNLKKTFKRKNNESVCFLPLDMIKFAKDLALRQISVIPKKRMKKASKLFNILYKLIKRPVKHLQSSDIFKLLFLFDCFPLYYYFLVLLHQKGGHEKWMKIIRRLGKRTFAGGLWNIIRKMRQILNCSR
jgi:hypothetical protein